MRNAEGVRRLPRRPVLLGMTATLAVPVLAGCGSRPPDPLVALVVQARSDAVSSAAAAQALRTGSPRLSDELAGLAAARRAHADAMAAELGGDAPDAPEPAPAERPGAPMVEPATELTGVRAALDEAQRTAAAAVPGLPRRRAALVGSVAACCAAYRSVLR